MFSAIEVIQYTIVRKSFFVLRNQEEDHRHRVQKVQASLSRTWEAILQDLSE
jgi:hypothetical protein